MPPTRPEWLPLLESLAWFDADPYALSPLEMLERYERAWQYTGVLDGPSAEELAYVRDLARRFGSALPLA